MDDGYDAEDNARKCYDLAIATLREQLMAERNPKSFLDGKVILHAGDCLEVLARLPESSVDSVVCDPPYHLTSIVSRYGKTSIDGEGTNEKRAKAGADGMARLSRGFMGKTWDGGDVAFQVATWEAVLRVLKPGGHLVAFGGTRTYHRMVCAIEDAGFEIRDQIGWAYGSGFPKSHDVSKAIDRANGDPFAWQAFATAYAAAVSASDKTHTEIDRALGIPSAGSNSCYWARSDTRGGLPPRRYWTPLRELLGLSAALERLYDEAERAVIATETRKNAPSGIVAAGRTAVAFDRDITAPATEAAQQWEGWGTALKPAWEPIVLARKPLIGTVAENVLLHGTGAINIGACRVETADDLNGGAYVEVGGREVSQSLRQGSGMNVAGKTTGRDFVQPLGRWPANVVHDGSEEVLAAFPDTGISSGGSGSASQKTALAGHVYGEYSGAILGQNAGGLGDSGSAARFFYTAKADAEDRLGSKHPTVKPLDLMQWLVRLVTPKGGITLDPFGGTGTTGEAAWREGMRAILIEREPEYQADIARRMELAVNPTKRSAVAKTKNNLDRPEDLPLFAAR